MTNYVYVLMTPHLKDGIGKVMRIRYKATMMDSEHYLLTCSRYIELNPIRAGMVKHPEKYTWSNKSIT